MNNNFIYVAKATNKAYAGRNGGVNLNRELPYIDLTNYELHQENAIFKIYRPKSAKP